MKTMILCAGQGTRLNEETEYRPKSMVNIWGKPILWQIMKTYAIDGYNRFVHYLGYMADMIIQTKGHRHDDSLQIDYSVETDPLGIGSHLKLASNQANSENVIVLNRDSFCGFNALDRFAIFSAHQLGGSISVIDIADTRRFGRVLLAHDCQIFQFLEKPPAEQAQLRHVSNS
jgi:NDP-sugar pyrophosphorylase family protein